MGIRSAAAAAVTLTATGFVVVGCSTSSSSTAAASATTPAASPAVTVTSTGTSAGQAAASATCAAAGLSYALGAVTGTSAQRTQVVDLTNKGPAACTLDGYPGVDLAGVANGKPHYSWSLVRAPASYSRVTLPPGGTAHFSLTYLPGTSASTNISVTKLVMTPPNDYTQAELTWNQSVVLQDAATRPGTYISPVTAGA